MSPFNKMAKNERKELNMRCPTCGYADSRVIDSRPTEEGSIRRRQKFHKL